MAAWDPAGAELAYTADSLIRVAHDLFHAIEKFPSLTHRQTDDATIPCITLPGIWCVSLETPTQFPKFALARPGV